MRTFTLFVPSLFWPDAEHPDTANTRMPALELALARGERTATECEDGNAWKCRSFGIQRNADWPVAPVALLGEGEDPGAHFWLRADPVHLQAQRDGLVLHGPEELLLTTGESTALLDTLECHFESQGLHFLAPHPARWYARVTPAPHIRTVNLAQALGRDIDRLLPTGEARLTWHRLINEIQMCLHDHPVNIAREQRGSTVVNSLWFWGGGTLPDVYSAPFDRIVADEVFSLGLGRLTGLATRAAADGPDFAGCGNDLAVVTEAETAALRGDPMGWQSAMSQIEQRWFAPLSDALREGTVDRAFIVTVAHGQAFEWALTRPALRRFWRRPRPLSAYMHDTLTAT